MRKEETVTIDLLRRAVSARNTDERSRALSGQSPIRPESVQKYLEGKSADALEDVSKAMLDLAKSLPSSQLAEKAYGLYEKFRSEILPAKRGGCYGPFEPDTPTPSFLPFFTSYIQWSANRSRSFFVWASSGYTAIPKLAVSRTGSTSDFR